MPMTSCFASIPGKGGHPALREFSDDDIQVKNKRFAFPNDQFYFKTQEEMSRVFQDLPEAIDNTNEIVDKVELLKLTRDILLPNFPIEKDSRYIPKKRPLARIK